MKRNKGDGSTYFKFSIPRNRFSPFLRNVTVPPNARVQPRGPKACDGWNEWLVTMFTKDDFLFLGPRHPFYLRFSNKSFGTRQAFLLI
jgi:hypothetical protein